MTGSAGSYVSSASRSPAVRYEKDEMSGPTHFDEPRLLDAFIYNV
jgi:hypothetical protein